MKTNLFAVALSISSVVSLEPFLRVQAPSPAGGKNFMLYTDDYLSSAKMLFGSEDRTGFLEVDFHTEYTFLTGTDCDGCVVQTYNAKESTSRKDPDNKGVSIHY